MAAQPTKSIFIVSLTYKKSLAEVEKFVVEHRSYLDQGYKSGILIVSGPKNPRTGGIILSATDDRQALEVFLKNDPFYINGIAEFEIIEFFANKFTPAFAKILEN